MYVVTTAGVEALREGAAVMDSEREAAILTGVSHSNEASSPPTFRD